MKNVLFYFLLIFSESVFAQEPRLVLPIGHTETIKCATFSNNGKYVASCSANGQIILWEVSTGKEIRAFETELVKNELIKDFRHISFSPDDQFIFLITETSDYFMIFNTWYSIFDLNGNLIKKSFFRRGNEKDNMSFIDFKNNRIAQQIDISHDVEELDSYSTSEIILEELQGNKILDTLKFDYEILSFQFANDGNSLFAITENKLINLSLKGSVHYSIPLESGIETTFKQFDKIPFACLISSKDQFNIVNLSDGKIIRHHEDFLGNAFIFNDNKSYTFLTSDSTRLAFDVLSGKEIWRIKEPMFPQFFEKLFIDQSGNTLIGVDDYEKNYFHNMETKKTFSSSYSILMDCNSGINRLLTNTYFSNEMQLIFMSGIDKTIKIGGIAEGQEELAYDPKTKIVTTGTSNAVKYWDIKTAQPLSQIESSKYGFIHTINESGTIGLIQDSSNTYSIFHSENGTVNKIVPIKDLQPYIEEIERFSDENNSKTYYYIYSDPICLGEDCQQLIWLLNDSTIGLFNSNSGGLTKTVQSPQPLQRIISNKSGKKAVSYDLNKGMDEPHILSFTIWNPENLSPEKTIKVNLNEESTVLSFTFSENEGSLIVLYRYVNLPSVINVLTIDLLTEEYTIFKDHNGLPHHMNDEMANEFANNSINTIERGKLIIFQSGKLSILTDSESKTIIASSGSKGGFSFNAKGDKFYSYHGPFLKAFDINTGKLSYSIKSDKGSIESTLYSPKDEYLLCATNANELLIYDGQTGIFLKSIELKTDVKLNSISPNLQTLTCIGDDLNTQIWDLKTGTSIKTFEFQGFEFVGTEDFTKCFLFDDGKKVFYLTTVMDILLPPKAYIYDLEKDKLIYETELTSGYDGQLLYSDSVLDVIEIGSEILYISDTIENISFSREFTRIEASLDGKLLILSESYQLYPEDFKRIEVFEIASKSSVISFIGELAKISPDQKRIAFSDNNNKLHVYDISKNVEIGLYDLGSKKAVQIEFTESSDEILVLCSANSWEGLRDLKYFKIGNSKVIWEKNELKGDKFNLLAGNKYILFDESMFNGPLTILDLNTGQQMQKFEGHTFHSSYSENGIGHLQLFDNHLNQFVAYDIPTFSRVFSIDLSIYLSSINNLVNNTDFYIEQKNMYETVVRRSSNQESLYTRVQLAGDDWLVYDEFYRYDGSPAAREKLHFVCGLEILDLSQMKDALYVPGLAEKKINNQEINYDKLSELDICSALPVIIRVDDPTNDGYIYRITPQRLQLDRCEIYIENKLIKTVPVDELNKEKNNYLLMIPQKYLEPHLIPGESNEIRIVGVVKKGQSELRSRGVVVTSVQNKTKIADVNLYAIMVGVSDYKADELDLQFPVKDALALGTSLEQSARKLLGEDHVFMYNINSEVKAGNGFNTPEREGVRKAFEDIGKKAKAEDIILVFFAGHGVMEGTADKKFTFLTAEASRENLVGISTTDLQSWLSPEGPYKMLANKTILIFDACNSGQASKELMALATRNDDDSKRIRQVEDLKDKAGMFILAASAPNQSAYELPQYQQGLLTYALLKTLKHNPAILDDNQFLNVQKWFLESEAELKRIIESLGQQQDAQPFGSSNIRIGIVDSDVQDSILLAAEKPMVVCVSAEDITSEIDHLKLQEKVNTALNELNVRGTTSKVSYVNQGAANTNNIKLKYEIKGDNIACSMSLIKDQDRYFQQTFEISKLKVNDLVLKIIELAEENAK